MSEFIHGLIEFFEMLVSTIGYPGVFLVMFAENLIPPIPTDPLLPFAGLLVANGEMEFIIVWMLAVSGALTGSVALYSIGAWADDHVVRRLVTRYGRVLGIDEPALDRAFCMFDRYGAPMILIGRNIPVIRSAVTLASGMSRMPIYKFLFFTSIHSIISTGFYISIGYLLGENWREVFDYVRVSSPVLVGMMGVIVLLVIYWMLRRYNKRHRAIDMAPVADITRAPKPEC